MSSRALRKAQRQREQQRQIEAAETPEQESSEDESINTLRAANRSMFAALDLGHDEDEGEDEVEAETEAKAPTAHTQNPAAPEQSESKPTPGSSSKRKKKKKKGKGGGGQANKAEEQGDDEFDIPTAAEPSTAVGTAPTVKDSEKYCKLLVVDTQNLHVLNEMRRLFGRDAVDAERREVQAQAAGARRGGRAAVNSRLAAIARRRNVFIQGREDWPNAPSGGLGMEIDRQAENGVTVYKFVHSLKYQDVQRQFEMCVAGMDPQRLVTMMLHNRTLLSRPTRRYC
jgi:hypothetical protein